MVLLKLLILTLTFYELIVDLDARTCPKGQRVTSGGDDCENCPDKYYQSEENDSKYCQPCTKCDEQSGSVVKEKCTKETDTKCQCRGDFVSRDTDSSTCKCDIGFGLKNGDCLKCEHGYFSTSINSNCQKWKDCKSAGVNITGTKTSDVICNDESRSFSSYVTTPPTSNKIVSLITHLTSHRPHEGTQTQKMHTTTTTSAPGDRVIPNDKVPSDTGNHIGMALLIFGIVGLLVLTAVTCKLQISSCVPIKPAVQRMSQY
ncbi:tumor necrosis factor receptor superfamily member 5 isoform X2 [Siniperca chuatsi]|uniref:tumor necrosis factor receptor superfamily member 5 isoform X2 n=1 Tax=Siniperca chuatsi TaxID=119488 RepID=UPI001CE0BA54|nr:tumor necrosis factor receptor superfamily member 5 isoform X2 [Siniperca chuatsi]